MPKDEIPHNNIYIIDILVYFYKYQPWRQSVSFLIGNKLNPYAMV